MDRIFSGWVSAALLVLTLTASAEQPLLVVGGDGHTYLIGEGAKLHHIHDGKSKELPMSRVFGVLKARTGVFVNAGDHAWIVEGGDASQIAPGSIVEIAEATDGTYLYLWTTDGMKTFLLR